MFSRISVDYTLLLLQGAEEEKPRSLEEEEEPLDMSWPDTWKKRLTYVLVALIVIPLWITLPDVRKPVSWLSLLLPSSLQFSPVSYMNLIIDNLTSRRSDEVVERLDLYLTL